jgi:chemotaxis protein MotB
MSGHRASRMGDDHDEEHENAERWLLTYADMITLLLALFMVLFALSSVSANKFAAFKEGLTSAFKSSANSSPTLKGGTGLLAQPALATKPVVIPHPASASAQLQQVQKQIDKALRSTHQQSNAAVHLTKQGLIVRVLTNKVFFATGKALLEPEGAHVIDTVGKVIVNDPNAVEVLGYTDNTPVNGSQLGNFELSSARANTVLERLATHSAIDPGRLSATGDGANHPVASNATAAGKAANRRVDIVLLPEGTSSS